MGRNKYAIIATLGIGPTHCFQQSLSGYKSSRGVDLGRFFSLLILQRNRKLEHMNDARGYSLTARLLHWVMAFIMITMLIAGIAMVYGPWEGKFPPARGMLYDYHRGMGFVLLVLVVVSEGLLKTLENFQAFGRGSDNPEHALGEIILENWDWMGQ